MKVVIAIDSYKGCMSSLEAGLAAKRGVLAAGEQLGRKVEVEVFGLADGGEGTTETLAEALNGQLVRVKVHNPLGELIEAEYAIVDDLAVMEMAAASGLPLIREESLDPVHANTYGFGEMLQDAYAKGCKRFLIGIGGSATTEAGIGMMSALGYRFLDSNGGELPANLEAMGEIATIDDSAVDKDMLTCDFQVACDVTNPLLGEEGAVAVFGRQKGVKEPEVMEFDKRLGHFADVAENFWGRKCRNNPGAGAAGGLGFTLSILFENILMESGADIIIRHLGIEKALEDADILITGEGRIDAQTAMGKGPAKVAELGHKHGAEVIAFGGCLGDGAEVCNTFFDGRYVITPAGMSKKQALSPKKAQDNMEKTVKYVIMDK